MAKITDMYETIQSLRQSKKSGGMIGDRGGTDDVGF
jgi:hypothetical protein